MSQIIELNLVHDHNPNQIKGFDLNLKEVKFDAMTLNHYSLTELSLMMDRYTDERYDADLYNYYTY